MAVEHVKDMDTKVAALNRQLETARKATSSKSFGKSSIENVVGLSKARLVLKRRGSDLRTRVLLRPWNGIVRGLIGILKKRLTNTSWGHRRFQDIS